MQPPITNNASTANPIPSTTENMVDAVDDINRQDIWDDSALVQSWDEALAEYKKYHSLHATGRSLDDLLSENERQAKSEPLLRQHDAQSAPQAVAGESTEASGDGQGNDADTVAYGAPSIKDHLDSRGNDTSSLNGATRGTLGQSQGVEHASASIMPPPQALLGSVQDENLKKLLMSWYYAGFYTGLYEGQQKQRN